MTADPYRLKASRGPKLELDPHPESCDLTALGEYAEKCKRPLAVDLFCCGGGLSLGLEEAGFDVVLGVDIDEYAIETYRAHFGGASLRADLSDAEEISGIIDALDGINISLVAGSPPCQPFSRAGSSKIRSLIQQGVRSEEDERRELWKGFLKVVEELNPPLVLMENVPDLASGEYSRVFRKIVDALEGKGYDVHTRILPSWQYGVPQHRHRLFIVGARAGTPFTWPMPIRKDGPGVEEAISDLPAIVAGETNDGLLYGRNGSPPTTLQRWFRRGQPRGGVPEIHDHFARAVREDDLQAFRLMTSRTRYSELPEHLRRYTTEHFDDKYKRLDLRQPSRTITAHIARDGYWYIHPEEDRTLTMREAARIQSFPDRFRFAGTPSHAFRQIGEAVPPLVARAVGRSLLKSISHVGDSSDAMSTKEVSSTLSQWILQKPESELMAPWRMSRSPWLILMGMAVLERRSARVRAASWPFFRTRWPDPKTYLSDKSRGAHLGGGNGTSRELLDDIARDLGSTDPCELSKRGSPPLLSDERWKMAWTLAGESFNLRCTAPARRVAERFFGIRESESRLSARTEMARLVGVHDPQASYAAVLEIGEQYCRPKDPLCEECPVREHCAFPKSGVRVRDS